MARSLRRRVVRLGAVIGFLLIGVGCERSVVGVPRALRVPDITTGWFDAGSHDLAQNKLVPIITFRLDNVSAHELGSLQVQGMFRRAGDDEGWGSTFIRAVGREELAPGASAGPFTLRSELGYTGKQARREMFEHKDFVDVTVELLVKHRSAQWVRLNRYQIEQQLITEQGCESAPRTWLHPAPIPLLPRSVKEAWNRCIRADDTLLDREIYFVNSTYMRRTHGESA